MEEYKLSKPIEFMGETVTEILMDLESLTVAQLEKCEKQARAMLDKKESFSVPETNKKYLSCVAAKASGVKLDLIRSLSGSDYTQVCLMVQNFLLNGDSDSMEDFENEDEETYKSFVTNNSKTLESIDLTGFRPDYVN